MTTGCDEKVAWKDIVCPVCSSSRHKQCFVQPVERNGNEHTFRFVSCGNCGLIYTNPLPASDVFKFYVHMSDPRQQMLDQVNTRSNIFRKGISEINRLNRNGQPWKILDVGCATGVFLNLARSHGYDVFGVEASPAQARWAKEWFKLRVECAASIGERFAESSMDVVTMWDVLEHVAEPGAMLKEIRAVLRENGFLLLKVPNGSFTLAKAKILRRIYPRGFDFMGAGEHLVHYSAATVRRLLESAGFRVLKIANAEIEEINHPIPITRAAKKIKRAIGAMLKLLGDVLRMLTGQGLFVLAMKES